MAFIDLKMGKISGLDVLENCCRLHPHILSIIMTAYGTVEKAVQAMKIGAFDFILKPFGSKQMEIILGKGGDWLKLNEREQFFQKQLTSSSKLKPNYFVFCRSPNSNVSGEQKTLKLM